jgi:hypothetical protein
MFTIGQAVRLRAGSAWDKVLSANAVGVVIGIAGEALYRVAFPTGDGRPPLIGEFVSGELVPVLHG